jgi:cardiolipin synthase
MAALLLLLAADGVAVAFAIARKRDAASALAWSFAILFLPIIGLLLFLVFGRDRLPRRLKRKVVQGRRFAERLQEGERLDDGELALLEPGWGELSRVARSLGSPPNRAGNRVKILARGEDAFAAIAEAISEARHHIHVEEYIFRDDTLGRALLELLVARARRGVEVRLVVDAVGTPLAGRLIRQLEKAGGQGSVFLPILPFGHRFSPNLRNHRKIIVCDGRVGFLGGMNVGDEYFGRRVNSRYWCDSHLRIEGPAVRDLQFVFAEDWDFATGELLDGEAYFPKLGAVGEARAQILHSGPDEEINSTRSLLFGAITQSRRELRIASPYFVPDLSLRDALRSAARRGVEVKILTQGRPPEVWLAYQASRFYWHHTLAAGVRIFEMDERIFHSKLLIADDGWATLGSANLDNRSLRLNFEVQCLLDGASEVEAVTRHFDSLLAGAREVQLEEFSQRPAWKRGVESLARLAAPML